MLAAIRRSAPTLLVHLTVHVERCRRTARSDGSLCKPSPPCRFKALIRLGSRLAVMHTNDDSPGVRSTPFPDQMRREGHLKSASLPNRLSSFGRSAIVGTVSRRCPEARKSSMWIRSPRVTDQQDGFCRVYPERGRNWAAPRPDVRRAWPQLS